jgi:hypothetical protein
MSQGRKRGLCGIIATQRLSKLHKDAAAETNNVIIGRTWLDGDQQRAGDLLGMSKAERLKLRDLEQGEFYAFGPVLNFPGVPPFPLCPGEYHPAETRRAAFAERARSLKGDSGGVGQDGRSAQAGRGRSA